MIISFNRRLLPPAQATVSVFDRGFVLGDGVYEAFRAFRGVPVAIDRHIERLRESLIFTGIPYEPDELAELTDALLQANNLQDAFVYWQVTRGTPAPGQPPRSRTPAGPITPTVFGYASPQSPLESLTRPATVEAAIIEDRRWNLGRIKSISLAGNIQSALDAKEKQASEAVMIKDGLLTEACASNVILALPDSSGATRLVTPSLESVSILAGITRARVLELDPSIEECPVPAADIARASEIIFVGTTSLVSSVTRLDGRPVGSGGVGPEAARLYDLLIDATRAEVDAALACARVA